MLLRDQDLYNAISSGSLRIDHLPPLSAHDWHAMASPVQPASLDLRIGRIYLPGVAAAELGSVQNPLRGWSLHTGHTAVVVTREVLHLPHDLAAIGFPPSSVSSQGLLMTNPGHVDPGYEGPLRFTVINMGKESYPLQEGAPIVTLLLFRLASNAYRAWPDRGNPQGRQPTEEEISKLSADFVDVEKRASAIAQRTLWTAGIGATVVAGAVSLVLGWVGGVSDLRTKVAELESKLGVATLQRTVQDLDSRLKTVEQSQPARKTP